jgi:hypothetical protein
MPRRVRTNIGPSIVSREIPPQNRPHFSDGRIDVFLAEQCPSSSKESAIMSSWIISLRNVTVFAASVSLSLVGCGSVGGTGLPETVTIELPDGTTVEAEQGAGAPSLANSQWQFFRTAGSAQALPFVTVIFGPDGELESFEDNTIAQEIFGDTILFDGARHNTAQKGLQYAAATFGAETADASGFTFEGRLTALAAGIEAATATATATATYEADDPDTVVGTFTFSTRVSIAAISNGNTDDEFTFVGRRVTGAE